MAKPQGDRRDINARLEQMGGCCMANKMRGNWPREETGAMWRGVLNRFVNQIIDAMSRQRSSPCIGECHLTLLLS